MNFKRIRSLFNLERCKNIAIIIGGFSLLGIILFLVAFIVQMQSVWSNDKVITVIGTASKQYVITNVPVQIRISTEQPTQALALEMAQQSYNETLLAMKEAGIPNENIKTDDVTTSESRSPSPEKTSWYGSATLVVTVTDMKKADTLQTLVEKIKNVSVYPITPHTDKKSVKSKDLVAEAMRDADAKAQEMATQGGRQLKEMIGADESNRVYFYYNNDSTKEENLQSISQDVSVRYRIQ